MAGGLLQIGGVLIVFFEIKRNFRRASAYHERPRTVYARGVLSGHGSATATATGGHEPTLEEKVRVLEDKVRAVEDRVNGLRAELAGRMRSEMAVVGKDVERWTSDWNQAIERVLLGLAELRVVGVAAIVVGVALATVGSVLATG